MRKAYIIDAKRTPVGKARGLLSKTRADDLLVHAIQSVLKASDPSEKINNSIDDIIVGCAMPEGPQGLNIARIATLLAGLPDSTPAYTLNRFCSSGLQSVSNAADLIKSGSSDLVIAAGVESMSSVPMTGFKPSMNPKILSDENISIAYGMGLTAEKVVQKYGVSQPQDRGETPLTLPRPVASAPPWPGGRRSWPVRSLQRRARSGHARKKQLRLPGRRAKEPPPTPPVAASCSARPAPAL